MTYHIRWWISYAASLFHVEADILMESPTSGAVYNVRVRRCMFSVYNLGGWTVDGFFSCPGHFYIICVGHITSEQVLFDVFSSPVWIVYLVFSSPGGIILYIMCTSSSTPKICCKSSSEIIILHRLPYHTLVVLSGLRFWSPNGTDDDDVNIHISLLTSIFPSHSRSQMTCRCSLLYQTIIL